ncbi:MAG: non-hydrolyzing UDP-N-acetylglucosamine 2-epimerase [Oceanipulchritudo sp.]
MKIISIIGARPQFIKAAMLCSALDRKPGVIHSLVHTGQHYDHNMSAVFFEDLGIPEPEINLGIARGCHGEMTGRMLISLEKVLMEEKPDRVVVYGDTNTTLAGALASAKLHIPVAHVEAGLRSYNREMPEELNRILADDLSDALFAPTRTAVRILEAENKPEESIHFTGDIMFDAALKAARTTDEEAVLQRLNARRKEYVLATIHRAENTDDRKRLLHWFDELEYLGRELQVLFPLHPRTRKCLMEARKSPENFHHIRITEPVGYREMAVLTKNSGLVITDSGGLQKEAYFHKVPSLVLRDQTEWVELLDTKWSQLVPCRRGSLSEARTESGQTGQWDPSLFGEGNSAAIMADILTASF